MVLYNSSYIDFGTRLSRNRGITGNYKGSFGSESVEQRCPWDFGSPFKLPNGPGRVFQRAILLARYYYTSSKRRRPTNLKYVVRTRNDSTNCRYRFRLFTVFSPVTTTLLCPNIEMHDTHRVIDGAGQALSLVSKALNSYL